MPTADPTDVLCNVCAIVLLSEGPIASKANVLFLGHSNIAILVGKCLRLCAEPLATIHRLLPPLTNGAPIRHLWFWHYGIRCLANRVLGEDWGSVVVSGIIHCVTLRRRDPFPGVDGTAESSVVLEDSRRYDPPAIRFTPGIGML